MALYQPDTFVGSLPLVLMEKVTIMPLVLGHLTRMDFISAFVGWLLRCAFTWSDARHKVVNKGCQPFSNGRYLAENWDRLLVSNLCSLGLLLFLPEIIILILSATLGHAVSWISAFSGLIGLLGTDIVNSIMRGGKRRLTRLIGGDEALPTPDEGTPSEPGPSMPGAAVLLLVCSLALLGSCTTARERALNQAQRHARKVASILAQYPDLADKLVKVERDTLRSSANQDSARYRQATDTTAFGRLLDEYVRQRLQAQTSTIPDSASTDNPVDGTQNTVEGTYKIPARQPQQQRNTTVNNQASYLKKLREQLQRGAGRDSTYTYQDAYLSASIQLKNGVLGFKYQLAPQKIPYDKNLITLRPAPALPEDCVPKHFWHDWLFWLLLVLVLLLLGLRARLKLLLPWIP